MTIDSAPALDLAPLRAGFAGTVLTPADGEAYDVARTGFNAMFDRRPAVVAQATSVADVVHAVGFARSSGLPLAVRGGGHSVAGYSTIEGGLLLDLGPMKGIEVDPVARVARVQPGVVWGELDRATQAHGLATTGGRMTTTGVAGFALGSGSGWLERLHGTACDNLLAAEVVTADGRVVTASDTDNPDLLWGLRGAGGNFGIVTEFTFRLHPIGPEVYGGRMMFPISRAPEVLRSVRDFFLEAPREVCGGMICMTAPQAPFVPEEMRGRPAVGIMAAYWGDVEAGASVLAPLKALGAAVDMIGPTTYLDIQASSDPSNPPGRRNYWRSEFMPTVPDEVLDAAIACAMEATSPASALILAPLGGAFGDVAEDATALGGRAAQWLFHCYAIWENGDPDGDARHIAWARSTAAALEPWTMAGMGLNLVSDVDESRIRETFGAEKYARLTELKRAWDPENFFAMNQNIRPVVGPR
ncbi:FAD-binding oxidoreductase [Nocardioides humilatus]|uniref:FAD-binding oxidoreductase n=1 Tax=Nocardioides humilatus TaxID=2607660 RepID=A0A5B1LHQ5_9ACTN|nr:FAD-binding oxidoreductase [Nocardioides humilatus]KAA1419330.1 FAD-binding oxidoreductase [Nocardioides humilatus]